MWHPALETGSICSVPPTLSSPPKLYSWEFPQIYLFVPCYRREPVGLLVYPPSLSVWKFFVRDSRKTADAINLKFYEPILWSKAHVKSDVQWPWLIFKATTADWLIMHHWLMMHQWYVARETTVFFECLVTYFLIFWCLAFPGLISLLFCFLDIRNTLTSLWNLQLKL